MSTTTLTTNSDYKVADIKLADWGRKEIEIAEKEMPGLISIREKYAAEAPGGCARDRFAAHDHPDGSADRDADGARCHGALGELQYLFDAGPRVAAAIAKTGVPVYAWKGETLEEYWDCTWKAIVNGEGKGPQLVVDDGGDVIPVPARRVAEIGGR